MHSPVIPVKTGIQFFQWVGIFWIPACAGMTTFCEIIIIYTKDSIFLRENKIKGICGSLSAKELALSIGSKGKKIWFFIYFFVPTDGASTSRTLYSSALRVKGFCKKAVPASKTPWWTMALSG